MCQILCLSGQVMALVAYVCVRLLLYACAVECVGDYYSLLGVSCSATEKEIKKAFRQLALKYHPDRNHSPDAQQTFTHLAQAYEVLTDQESRRLYDQTIYLGQCNEKTKGKPDPGYSVHHDKGRSYGNSESPFSSVDDLLDMLRMEEDLFMGGEVDIGTTWSFTLWDEGFDEDDQFSLFGMV